MLPNTVTTVRVPLFVVLLICAASAIASAKPRHVAVLEFDGPKPLAENSRRSVLAALKEYDLVSPARWQAELDKAKEKNGPTSWFKASEKAGVEAVVEGGFETLGGRKFLVVSVIDASTGKLIDQPLQIDVGGASLSSNGELRLAEGLASRLELLPEPLEVKPTYPATARLDAPRGSKGDKRAKAKQAVEQSGPVTTPAQTPGATTTVDVIEAATTAPGTTQGTPATAATAATTDVSTTEGTPPAPPQVATAAPLCNDKLGDCVDLHNQLTQTPAAEAQRATPRFRFSGGGFLGNRNLTFHADGIDNLTQLTGVDSKGFALSAEIYPFPLRKTNGQLSGIGFTFSVYKSVGSTVGIDDDSTTGDYTLNQNGFAAAVHWRQPLGIAHLDTEVGYSQDDYTIEDPPEGFEVPDTAYRAVHAGVHVDLAIADRASVGFGGRYFYVLGQGDLTSTEFYGPGDSSGFGLDAHFVVPLPNRMFVRGELDYKRITTEFTGGGVITDDEDVFDSTDSWINATVQVGIEF
jgi:hypothetical protein